MISQRTQAEIQNAFVQAYIGGKEEPTSMARILYLPQPLPNETNSYKKYYWISIGVISLGLWLGHYLLTIMGIFIFVSLWAGAYAAVGKKLTELRYFKFIASAQMNHENLFENLQPIFINKYGMQTELRKDGGFTLRFNGTLYDILIWNDTTFTIWWRKDLGLKTLLPNNRTNQYTNALAAMGIIAYEIQKYYGINNEQSVPINSQNFNANNTTNTAINYPSNTNQ